MLDGVTTFAATGSGSIGAGEGSNDPAFSAASH